MTVTDKGVNGLLEERARLVARAAAVEGNLFFAELHLRRAAKYLKAFIAPTPALGVARDTLVDEIAELLAEDRPHPPESLDGDSPETPAAGEGEAPAAGMTCKTCDGGGEVAVRQDYWGNWETERCLDCNGTGEVAS